MTSKEIRDIVKSLRKDNNYYGEMGRKFLSTSDIKILHNDPQLYGAKRDDTPDLIKGDYFHKRILQPELVDTFTIIDAGTRSAKAYKDIVSENTLEGMPPPIYLLKKEVDELEILAMKVESNDEFVDALQANKLPNEVEEPMVGEVLGYWFKGKADRINNHRGFIADIKTTRSMAAWHYNFKKLGYHAQAYVYQKLFGMPMRFYVISKEDGRLGVYDVSQETLQQAENYIKWGLERLEMFYGANPLEEIDQYYEYMEL